MAEISAKAALKASSISPENIDHVIFGNSINYIKIIFNILGNVIQSSKDAAYLARHVGIRIGLPIRVPAVTINRLCGSGFEAIIQGAQVDRSNLKYKNPKNLANYFGRIQSCFGWWHRVNEVRHFIFHIFYINYF